MTQPPVREDVTAQLAARFEELRVAYERFMLGVDRIEPATLRQRFLKDLRRQLARPPNNTAQNFRLQALKARLFTYESLWDRHLAAREASFGPRRGAGTDAAAAPAAPTAPRPAPAGSGAAAAQVQNPPLQTLYDAFVAAHAEGSAKGPPPAYSAFEAMVAKQTQSIKERTGWQNVGLRVTMNQGRPGLQAFNGEKKDG